MYKHALKKELNFSTKESSATYKIGNVALSEKVERDEQNRKFMMSLRKRKKRRKRRYR